MTSDKLSVDVRVGDWMQTFTGMQFWPLDPRPDDVCIIDIAHSLSMLCRYGGHTTRFYSVAEHCCHMCDSATVDNKLWALLHDAGEAYLSDVIRPIKPFLTNYKEIENRLMKVICDSYSLPTERPQEVTDLDNRILGDEMIQAMSKPPADWCLVGEPLGVTIQFWDPSTAKKEFLNRFTKIVPVD